MSVVDDAIASVDALPAPVGEQKDVLALDPRGHIVVLGTAGSGKTTMAVLRALHLSDRSCSHFGKTLLVTYNKSLLAYLGNMLPQGVHDLDVRNYHHFARGYLNTRGQMSWDCIAEPEKRRDLILAALNDVRGRREDAVLARPDEFFLAELAWIAHNGHLTRDAYLSADRGGRGTSLGPSSREAVFDVQETYVGLREAARKRYDWEDLASAVAAELEVDESGRLYRHVVIDEGQDFSPEMIRSLALAIPPDGSLSFFGDVAQQIYGRAVSWRAAGLKVGRVWEFKKNYRNSPEIARLGLAIADMPYYADQPDMVAPDQFADAGPPPTVVRFESAGAEEKFVREQATAAGRLGTVGILCRTDADARRVARGLRGAQHLYSEMRAWRPEGISYGNVHSAKGYEFQTVILVGLTADLWPHPRAIEQAGEEEATALDGRLLYVGVTRARQGLIMTRTGDLTELMPANGELWLDQSR